MNDANLIANLLNSFRLILPEIVLVVVSCVIFLGGTLLHNRHLWAAVTLAGLALAFLFMPAPFLAHIQLRMPIPFPDMSANVYVSPLLGDSLAQFIRCLALAGGAIFVLFSWNEVGDRQAGDFYGCMLILLAGLSLTGAANELITLFLALEMISIPTYVMLYLPRHDKTSQEAALKYFMLSIFSSAILLFGFSYLYGLTGSTNISVLMKTLGDLSSSSEVPLIAQVAVIMVVAGLGFRIAAVPFHFYAPDVYQGSPTVMAALLAFVPKVAGFAALLRVLGFVLPANVVSGHFPIGTALSNQVPILLVFLALITMSLGNVLAVRLQDRDNLKRLFAYSSVAHAGYMLIALATAPYLRILGASAGGTGGPDGIEALLYYLVAYSVMTVGAFAVLAYLHSSERPVETIDDLAGLSGTHPWVALLMTIFLFSLIGIPFTAGFNGKLLIFFGAIGVTGVDARIVLIFRILAVIGVINAAIGAWYYLRVLAVMYLRTSVIPVSRPGSIPGFATIVICAVLTVGLSIPPGATWLLRAVQEASGKPVHPLAQVSQAEK